MLGEHGVAVQARGRASALGHGPQVGEADEQHLLLRAIMRQGARGEALDGFVAPFRMVLEGLPEERDGIDVGGGRLALP